MGQELWVGSEEDCKIGTPSTLDEKKFLCALFERVIKF
jgi:hypothetical protein